MSSTAAARMAPDPKTGSEAGPRKVSPEIAEVLHLIGAMERLIDDVEERRRAAGTPQSD